jgi:hypothetical protein
MDHKDAKMVLLAGSTRSCWLCLARHWQLLLLALLHLVQLFPQVIPLLAQLPVPLLQLGLAFALTLHQQLHALDAIGCCQLLLLLQGLEAGVLNLGLSHLYTQRH